WNVTRSTKAGQDLGRSGHPWCFPHRAMMALNALGRQRDQPAAMRGPPSGIRSKEMSSSGEPPSKISVDFTASTSPMKTGTDESRRREDLAKPLDRALHSFLR